MIELIIEVFSWRSIPDILLISFGLFFTYRTLKRLGTWKILFGLFLAFIIYFVANFFELDGTVWIYNNVSQVAVIGFIVLFQPEIRKLFEIVVSPRKKDFGKVNEKVIYLICDAVETLSDRKTGALIILPGKETIDGHIAGGHFMNADLSLPLILSIFDPHSPGHDGAMVIEKGKLKQFGLRLPISSNEDLPKEYGTRHFAAAGLTETTDSLVIAVSEERGTITVFRNGEGIVQKNKEQLISIVKSHWHRVKTFLPKVEKGKWFSPWSEVIISLLSALVIWYTVVIGGPDIHEKLVTIPIEYIGTPKDLVLAGEKPFEVKAHLVGPRSSLSNVEHYQVRIDLSNSVSGRQKFYITANNIDLPKNVKLLEVKPSSLSLELAQMHEVTIPIKPQLIGNLPNKILIDKIEINPDKIRAMVKSNEVNQSGLVLTTTPIYMAGITRNTTVFVKIIVPPRIQPIEKKWPDIEVKIRVKNR